MPIHSRGTDVGIYVEVVLWDWRGNRMVRERIQVKCARGIETKCLGIVRKRQLGGSAHGNAILSRTRKPCFCCSPNG